MSSIGYYTFERMSGEKLQPLSPVVGLIARPGTDGEIYREEPEKARVFEVQTTELYTLLAMANAAAAGYTAMKLTEVTVVDDLGLTTDYVLVVDVQNVMVQRVLSASVANVNYVVTARWLLKPMV